MSSGGKEERASRKGALSPKSRDPAGVSLSWLSALFESESKSNNNLKNVWVWFGATEPTPKWSLASPKKTRDAKLFYFLGLVFIRCRKIFDTDNHLSRIWGCQFAFGS